MPYEIKKINDNGYKVFKINTNKSFSNKPISLNNAKNQLIALRINTHNNDLKDYLKKFNFDINDYLETAKFVAQNRGYNPDLLNISDDGLHKLNYNGIKFGRNNYKDKIIYSWLELNGKLPHGTAKKKYTNYRKRAHSVMKKSNNKYSPASLSYYILW